MKDVVFLNRLQESRHCLKNPVILKGMKVSVVKDLFDNHPRDGKNHFTIGEKWFLVFHYSF